MPNWTDPCPTCPRKFRAIGGSGPQPSPILAIAERPGQDENRQGLVLVGKTGQEWDDLYLPLAGLDRSEVRVCNTVLCWAENNKTPSDKDILGCAASHIPDEIERTNPAVILLMGSSARKLVPGIKLELHHGIPQHTSKVGELFGWKGWLVPMYHPSIGLHESRWMKICMDDWEELGCIIREDYFADDPEPEETHYSLYQKGNSWLSGHDPIGIDTESHGGVPWSVQVSAMPGWGQLWRTDDREGMVFLRWMLSCSHNVVLHNAAYDLEVLRRLDIHVPSYRDTMQEAFHLGDLPQGLKALSYRLFRHTMTSYEETVWPASIRALQRWMLEALQVAQADLSFVERVQMKTKVKEMVHKGDLEKLLTRLLQKADETSDYNPWGADDEPRLTSFWNDPCNEWMISIVEARCGRYPIPGIANCSMDEAVRYAVGDADYTGRVAVELERRRQGAFKIHEGDRDR